MIIATTAVTVHARARLSDDDGAMWEIEPRPIRKKLRSPLRNYVKCGTRGNPPEAPAGRDRVGEHLAGKGWTTPACLRAPAAGFECGSARRVIEASGTAAHSVAVFPGARRFAKQGNVISNLHGEGTAMPTGNGSIGSDAAKAKRK